MPIKPKFWITTEIPDLERTLGGKLICPVCGSSGYGDWWWEAHRIKPHSQCHCGKVVLAAGLKRHQGQKGCTSE